MGRQTSIAMTLKDEEQFLAFLRSTTEIELFEHFAPTAESLLVQQFAPEFVGHIGYTIWNKAFPWTIEYDRVTRDASPEPNHNGWRFIANKSRGPVIEYSRHKFDSREYSIAGRIYWQKPVNFNPPVDYDIELFSAWYEKVVRWLRKNGVRVGPPSSGTYYLQDAYAVHVSAK